MRFNEAWLREWVNPPITTTALADQLTMAGLEVDALEAVAPTFTDVVVGAVLSVAPHPDAARLRVCRVDVGNGGEPLQIVCGAANVAAGMRVPVALIGANLPGGLRIERAKLRGVPSCGMICSAVELGLADSADGIWSLPADAPIGLDLRHYLGLEDWAIELDLTPDRGDCLSVAGIAREVGVLNRLSVTGPALDPVPARSDDRHPVELLAPAACPRYLCRIIRGVDPSAPSPLWLTERLRRAGLRPISALVDVTNYVLLELGQPLHAFDLARIDGPIRVRMAAPGESLALLNGDRVDLRSDTLVIADGSRPLALAGIMGGADSAVGRDTRDLLLESAFFAPAAVAGRARTYGLHTDSSHRFERGVDWNLQRPAIERATALILAIAGGLPGPVVEAVAGDHLPSPLTIRLRRARIGAVLGLSLADGTVQDILTRLGLQLVPSDDGWQVTVPSHRFDLQREVDLIGELGRVHGYDQVPVSHARASATPAIAPETAFEPARARQTLVARGWYEAITYSFVAPELQRSLDPDGQALTLANPLSRELSVMRTNLWPGLVQVAQQNLARQQNRLRLFETGLRFRLDACGALHQEEMIGGLCVGPLVPEQWGEQSRPADFFDLKADLEALFAATGRAPDYRFVAATHGALHPGRSARIHRAGEPIGWLGNLHPALAARLDLPAETLLFEVSIAGLGDGRKPAFLPLSKFPSVRRDIAVVLAAEVSWDAVRDSVTAAAGDWLRQLVLFDVYQGPRIEPGRKSMALGLILQAASQTLTDQDVESVMTRVITRLAADFAARLRD